MASPIGFDRGWSDWPKSTTPRLAITYRLHLSPLNCCDAWNRPRRSVGLTIICMRSDLLHSMVRILLPPDHTQLSPEIVSLLNIPFTLK
jgi:hypothetical protein